MGFRIDVHPIKPDEPAFKHSPTTKASGNDEDLEMVSNTGFTLEGNKTVFISFFTPRELRTSILTTKQLC